MPIDIAHTTSIAIASNILRDGFRIPRYGIMEDRCANFWETHLGSNQAAATGCVLWFTWDDEHVDANGLELSQMRPGILYRDNAWRSVIIPDTVTGLKFRGVDISFPDVDAADLESELDDVKSFQKSLLHYKRSKNRFVPVRVAEA
jgi:hypothetical protein